MNGSCRIPCALCATSQGKVLKREHPTTTRRCIDQLKIAICGDAPSHRPGVRGCVWNAEIVREGLDGRPDVQEVFHAPMLRKPRSSVNTQMTWTETSWSAYFLS